VLSERAIIELIKQKSNGINKIGDDAAILPLSKSEVFVITKDLLVEDIHFRTSYFDPESLAHKSLHVNLSDIAAMGAIPSYALLGLSIPKNANTNYIHRFVEAFTDRCSEYGIELIGGDTTASGGEFFISVTLLGRAKKRNVKFRGGGRIGDVVCVAGCLGSAYIGLFALENRVSGLESFKNSLLRPVAKLSEGKWFGEQKSVTGMMDISDGLCVDLSRLCKESGASAEIDIRGLIVTKEFADACKTLGFDPVSTQLSGGEDYGLLVCIEPRNYFSLSAKFMKKFGYSLTKIGGLVGGGVGKIRLVEGGEEIHPELNQFSHFGESGAGSYNRKQC